MITLNGQKVIPTMFPDNTSQIWKLDDINSDTFEICWDYENESELFHTCQLWDLINAYGKTSSLKIKYLPYARQDKSVSNETTFALHTFTRILNTMRFDKVEIVDPHSHIFIQLGHQEHQERQELKILIMLLCSVSNNLSKSI